MTRQDLLDALKDIKPPPEPAWWLPGYGHWLILALLLFAVAVSWLQRKRRRASRLHLRASRELTAIRSAYRSELDQGRAALELSSWLKRCALLAYPECGLAAANGDDWLHFLDSSLGDDSFSRGCGHVFGDAIYRPALAVDAPPLFELCDRWLLAIRPRLIEQGSG